VRTETLERGAILRRGRKPSSGGQSSGADGDPRAGGNPQARTETLERGAILRRGRKPSSGGNPRHGRKSSSGEAILRRGRKPSSGGNPRHGRKSSSGEAILRSGRIPWARVHSSGTDALGCGLIPWAKSYFALLRGCFSSGEEVRMTQQFVRTTDRGEPIFGPASMFRFISSRPTTVQAPLHPPAQERLDRVPWSACFRRSRLR